MNKNFFPYDRHLRKLARELRNNPTPAENELWQAIRKKVLGVEFHRQVPIHSFIVDFYCHEIGLVIEVDGSIHDYQFLEDAERQGKLEALGLRFLRFTNEEVFSNRNYILNEIKKSIDELTG